MTALRVPSLIVAIVTVLTACTGHSRDNETAVKVEVVKTESGHALYRGGEPYRIRGAGMIADDLERLVARGGNSIRNWSTEHTEQDTLALLDSAQALGVTVALGLPMQAERGGFDYDDEAAVAEQLESFRHAVLEYRDHPALLFWIIGNELNLGYENPAVFDAVNDVAEMIRTLDPNHPTTTALSGFKPDEIAIVRERAPALHFLSFQVYGALFGLADEIRAARFDAPFMVTEWGTIGYWEVPETPWGAPLELDSTRKAETYRRGYEDILSAFDDQLLGAYAFYWGQKQERTPTWFGLITERGEATEAVDTLQRLWTGKWPDNRSPRVERLTLAGQQARDDVTLVAGERYRARLLVTDPDADALTFRWEVKPESTSTAAGGDYEAPIPAIDGAIVDHSADRATVRLTVPGNYRLFAYASDGHGHAAHANVPFRVVDASAYPAELPPQSPDAFVAGMSWAVAYSGFREGQHPDRGAGAVNPSEAEILEDLRLLIQEGFGLIRLYDSGENSRMTLELIRKHDLPIRVLLGIWLDAEVSNHEGCPWLDEPIPESTLRANAIRNQREIARGIGLANEFGTIVDAVNVGNEALVDWSDHVVPLDTVIGYVRSVRDAIAQPVTVADNYLWWIESGAELAKEVDFLGVHSYPIWEGEGIDDGLARTIEDIERVRLAHPDKPVAVLEAGWATTSSEFGDRAGEAEQARYYRELGDFASASNATVFFFEAFAEPWKGDPADPLGAEKHWGLFFVDRTPKAVLAD